jgi:carboxyl-terminal processing protease
MRGRIRELRRLFGAAPGWKGRLVFLVMGAVGGFLLGCTLIAASESSDSVPASAAAEFRLMAEAWNTIERVYVDRAAVVPGRMTYGAIGGMVSALGDTGHSRFLSPEMVKIQREVTQGSLEGIGVELQAKGDQAVIAAPMDGSPAQRAGLQPGDVILEVNGELVTGLPLEEVVSRIAGPAHTPVELTILTPSTARTREVRLVRARIVLRAVTWSHLPGTAVAHLRIAQFSKGVTGALREALVAIGHEGLGGLILDLRNDPGGLFEGALGTASQFLASGDVVLERDSTGTVTRVRVERGGVALTLPMTVLINEGTASAAEIVAGALQDGRRAMLVGERSVGTGTILKPFPLSDGSALLLATKEWLTPSGRLIWHRGIAPDLVVPLPPGVSPLFPDGERGMSPAALRASGDVQLLRALDLLQHPPGQEARLPSPHYSRIEPANNAG